MDGSIRRAAIVEDDDKSPTKEELARETFILKHCLKITIVVKNKMIRELKEEHDKTIVVKNMMIRELKEEHDIMEERYEHVRVALTNEKNRATMERAHWRREAKRRGKKLNPTSNRVKYDDGQSGPTAEDAIAFEEEMEAIANEDMDMDEVAEMTVKMQERSGE